MARQKLVETVIVNSDEYIEIKSENLTESEQTFEVLNEKGEKKKYEAVGVYTFPISRPDQKNLNERIYPKKLWEKVIKEGQGSGNYGLIDHPNDDGSFKDAFCVWRDIRFSEDKKSVLADAYLFGSKGRDVKEALDAGGKVGISTVGFGEFKKDGVTIDETTYELDRPGDFVLNPSQQVFGTAEHEVAQESVEEKEEKTEENKVEETIKENTKETANKVDNTMSERVNTIEEKNFRMNVKNQMKVIAALDSLEEKLAQYEDLLTYFEEDYAQDLKETIEGKVKEVKDKLAEYAKKGIESEGLEEEHKTLKEKVDSLTEEKTSLEENYATLEEKFNKSAELLESLREYANKVNELYENQKAKTNGMISAAEYKELLVYSEDLEKQLEEMKKELRETRKENRELNSRLSEAPKKKKDKDEEEDDAGDTIEDPDKEKGEDPEMAGKDEKKKKEDDELRHNARPEVLEYYEDLESYNPGVVKIKEELLRCRTLFEAQRTYLRLKSLVREAPETSYDHFYREQSEKKPVRKEYGVERGNEFIRKGWM
jgi:hypothetical protein